MGDTSRGLYRKFRVARNDMSDGPGQKHEDCHHFVLDLNHDPFAMPAIKAYAEACRDQYPLLAEDLLRIHEKETQETTGPHTSP